MSDMNKTGKNKKGNGAVVAMCCSFVIGMGAMAYAVVPLYALATAALWLLALDQTFGWGVFGPKAPTS